MLQSASTCRAANRSLTPVRRVNDWYHVTLGPKSTLIVQRAYLDRRALPSGQYRIRIFGSILSEGKFSAEKIPLFCRIPGFDASGDSDTRIPGFGASGDSDGRIPGFDGCDDERTVRAFMYAERRIKMKVRQARFHHVMITCFFTSTSSTSDAPVAMQVLPGRDDYANYALPVHRPPTKQVVRYGMCVPVLYGSISDAEAGRLIEWVELHRMFGVSEFHLYNITLRDVSPRFMAVVDFYQKKNVIKWHVVSPPVDAALISKANLYDVSKGLDGAVLNQCFADNMFRFRYTLSVDLDEILVPRNARTYAAMLHKLHRDMDLQPKDIVSYVVPFAYFYLDFPPGGKRVNYSTSLTFTRRLKASYDTRVKSITLSSRCAYTYFHYCDVKVSHHADLDHARAVYYVEPGVALVHHYRRSCASRRRHNEWGRQWRRRQCKALLDSTVVDSYVSKFARTLTSRVQPIREQLHV